MNAKVRSLIVACSAACAASIALTSAAQVTNPTADSSPPQVSGGAPAEEWGRVGFYGIGDLGVNLVEDLGFVRFAGIDTSGLGKAEIKPGVRGTAGIGYAFLPWLAVEAEEGFIYNETKSYSGFVLGNFYTAHAEAWVFPATVGLVLRPVVVPAKPSPDETEYGQSFFRKLRPYFGGGVGAATIYGKARASDTSQVIYSDDGWDTEFTYYAKLGLMYAVSPRTEVGFQYRFQGISAFTLKQTTSGDITAHSLGAVLHVRF